MSQPAGCTAFLMMLAALSACDVGRAREIPAARRLAVAGSDSVALPSGFRVTGALSTSDGLVLWGRQSDSILLWPLGASARFVTGSERFRGFVGIDERSPGVLEVLDTLAEVAPESELKIGSMKAVRSYTRVHGIESADYGVGGWRAVKSNADSSFSFVDPTKPLSDLFRYRSPTGEYRARVDRAVVTSVADHYLVALRFFPYRVFKLAASGAVLDSFTPQIPITVPNSRVENTQLVLLRVLGGWDDPLLVLTDPFSLRRIVATRRGILAENRDARMLLLDSAQTWYTEIRAGSPTVLHRRVGGYRQSVGSHR